MAGFNTVPQYPAKPGKSRTYSEHEKDGNKITIKDETRQPLSNPTDEILERMKEIDKQYEELIPKFDPSVTGEDYTKKEHNPLTVEEIEDQATQSLEDYKNTSVSQIEKEYENDLSALNLQELQTQQLYEQAEQTAGVKEFLGQESTRAQAVAQGIDRSSIHGNMQQAVTDSVQAELESARTKYQEELDALGLKKNVLETEKEVALNKFDIAYATKLEQKIAQITTAQSKAQTEIDKYNARIDARLKELQDKFAKENAEEINAMESKKVQQKALAVFNVLKNLPKDEAKNILKTNPDIALNVGDWYNVLYTWLNYY